MTLQTCYKRLEIAKASNNQKQVKLWEERIKRKESKYKETEIYDVPKNSNGKKSKR